MVELRATHLAVTFLLLVSSLLAGCGRPAPQVTIVADDGGASFHALANRAPTRLRLYVDSLLVSECDQAPCRFEDHAERGAGSLRLQAVGDFGATQAKAELVKQPGPRAPPADPKVTFTRAGQDAVRLAVSSPNPIRRIEVASLGQAPAELCDASDQPCPAYSLVRTLRVQPTLVQALLTDASGITTKGGIDLSPVAEPVSLQVIVEQPGNGSTAAVNFTAAGAGSVKSLDLIHVTASPEGLRETVVKSCTETLRRHCGAELLPPSPRPAYSFVFARATMKSDLVIDSGLHLVSWTWGKDTDADGLPDIFEVLGCSDPRDPDSDHDSLLDGWEAYGRRFPDGYYQDFPGWGASPCVKDDFVEIDWEQKTTPLGTESTKPSSQALATWGQALAYGGVRLHPDVGTLGGGQAMPVAKADGRPFIQDDSDVARGEETYRDPHRLMDFGYLVTTNRDGTGTCDWPGFAMVDYGTGLSAWDQASRLLHEHGHCTGLGHGGQVGSGQQVQLFDASYGTFLTYASKWDDANRKPNYRSAMNYEYSYGIPYWSPVTKRIIEHLELSRNDLPDLDENDLCEPATCPFQRALAAVTEPVERLPPTVPLVLGPHSVPPLTGFTPPAIGFDVDRLLPLAAMVRYGCFDADGHGYTVAATATQSLYKSGPTTGGWQPMPATAPGIDWNCNGVIDPAGVKSSINGDGGSTGYWIDANKAYTGDVLAGREDYKGLIGGYSCPGGQFKTGNQADQDHPAPSDAYLALAHHPPCIEETAWKLLVGKHDGAHEAVLGEQCDGLDDDGNGKPDDGCADADQDGITDSLDNCILAANPTQADTQGDGVGDACRGPLPAPERLPAKLNLLNWTAVAGAAGYLVSGWDATHDVFVPLTTLRAPGFIAAEKATYLVQAISPETGRLGAGVTLQPLALA